MKRVKPLWIWIVVIAIGIIYLPGFSKYLRLKRRELELEREIKRLEAQISEVHKEKFLLKTDLGRLEQAAREELGLVKPGEVVYKVVEEEIPAKQAPARSHP